MRRIGRLELGRKPTAWLVHNQQQLDRDPRVCVHQRWKARRQTMRRNGIEFALKRMAGLGSRCMYCGDSEGCDIEHVYPKALPAWRARVFSWLNLLWLCAPCNRQKGDKCDLDEVGRALLLNPEEDNLWDFFDYVEESGQLAQRSDVDGRPLDRAMYTLREDVTRLLHEVICDGRKRSTRIMRRAIVTFLASDRGEADVREMIEHVLDAGHPELLVWYLDGLGARAEPFLSLAHEQPAVDLLRQEAVAAYPGLWPDQ